MNPIRAWNRFWFGPISARPLGAFRIAFGLIVLLHLALLGLELDYWLTDAGLLRGLEASHAAGPLRYSILQTYQDSTSVRVFFGALVGVTILYTLGWRTRVMGVLLYLGLLSIHHRNISSASGADVLVVIVAFYMMLSPAGAAFSLDARRLARRRGTLAEPLIVPWAQRLIQLHIALIYLNTGLLKASGASWQAGTALHFVLNNAELRRFDLSFLAQYPLLVNLMTYAGLLIELAIPFLIWTRAGRPWAIAMGLALHGGIMFMVNIPIFGELITACYLVYLRPEELNTALRLVGVRGRSRRRERAVEPPAPGRIPPRLDGPTRAWGPHPDAPAEGRPTPQPAVESSRLVAR